MKILLVGDIVAEAGRRVTYDQLLPLVQRENVDLVIANAENAAGGFGLTPKIAQELFQVGVHVITLGNHVWDKKDLVDLLVKDERLVRPANYPEGAPGEGSTIFRTGLGIRVGIIHLVGRVFMHSLDCPFRKALVEIERVKESGVSVIIVDFHAEATSEKVAMGWFLDGKVSAVLGTHTHVQTADEKILPAGTAYLTDVGMTGPVHSVIGFKPEGVLERFITQMPRRLEPATGPAILSGAIVQVDPQTGRALSIQRVQVHSE